MTKPIDLSGKRFGRLTVIDRAVNTAAGKARWNAICDCNTPVACISSQLSSGHTQSCGCLRRETAAKSGRLYSTTHGMSYTAIYRAWAAMKNRCYDKNHPHYHDYGGRGITVCDYWLESFESFLADMQESYGESLTLDREDNNKGYYKENCRWVNWTVQQRNRRDNLIINTPLGKMTVAEAGEKFNLKRHTIYKRIKNNWPEERLLEKVNE